MTQNDDKQINETTSVRNRNEVGNIVPIAFFDFLKALDVYVKSDQCVLEKIDLGNHKYYRKFSDLMTIFESLYFMLKFCNIEEQFKSLPKFL